jgi:hypothetical protein
MVARKRDHLPGEKRLLEHIRGSYPANEIIAELEFLISRKRVLGLLGGVADIRINSGSRSVVDFIRWANILTGMDKHILMESIIGPVSAPGSHAYRQMVSIETAEISRKLRKHGVSFKDFNTQTTRMGFPPWRFLWKKIDQI